MNSFVEGILGLLLFGASFVPIFLGVGILYLIAMKTQRYWEEPFARFVGIEIEEETPEEEQHPLRRYSA